MNDVLFQIKTMDATHTCNPFISETVKRHMSSDWLANIYKVTFKLQPLLTVGIFNSKYQERQTQLQCHTIYVYEE